VVQITGESFNNINDMELNSYTERFFAEVFKTLVRYRLAKNFLLDYPNNYVGLKLVTQNFL